MGEFIQQTKKGEMKDVAAEDAERQAQDMQAAQAASDEGQELKAELDELLDEIDDILEVNAEDFVKSYIQKGGQ